METVYETFLSNWTAFHIWKRDGVASSGAEKYADEPGFCFSATVEEIAKHDFVRTPGRYAGADVAEEVDEPFTKKLVRLGATLREQMNEARRLDDLILANLSEIEDAD